MSNEPIRHQHDKNCECGCHEEHHHESDQHDHKPITITTHDASIVGSYKFNIEKPYDEAEKILDDLLRHVSRDVTALGGIIGHIKALLTSKGQSCMMSITDDESDKHYMESLPCTVEGVAIVFFIAPEQLESILKKAFDAYTVV